ncbi:hypothetical protein [Microbacterium sp. CJ88]|uniref:hypothetical protein n=1 Tax=Microbacterium sp. CJ88 TaxID=3445672 RepID=UPI003F65C9E9
MTRLRIAVGALALAGLLVGATSTAAVAADGGVRPGEFCIPILLPCSTPSPTPSDSGTPTPSPPTTPGSPLDPLLPGILPGTGTTPAPAPTDPTTPPAQPAVPDGSAPVFTQPPAQLGAGSLSFSGLKGISVVTVPLADGSRATALKISADTITIDGFALTVRRATGPILVTTADRMTLSGNVQVYVNSLTATTLGGLALTLGADTPPPADGVAPGLLRVTLGLVGATADSIVYSNTVQRLTEG